MALTPLEDILVGLSIVFIGFFGFILNLRVASKLKIRAETNPDEKTNKLLVNMVFGNMVIIVLAFPLPAIASLLQKWIWGDLGCSYYGSSAMFLGMQIMMTSFMICIDLFFELNIKTYVGDNKNKIRNFMIAIIWVNSLVWSLVPFFGWSSYGKEPTGLSCTVVYKQSEAIGYISYMIAAVISCYIIPIFIMTACFFIFNSPESQLNLKEKESLHAKKRTIYLLIILFIIEWAPYTAYYIWPILDENVPIRLNAIAPLAAKLSVVFTPWVLLNCIDDKSVKLKEK